MTLSSAHAVAKKCSFLNSILNTNQFRLSKCMKRLSVNTGIFHRLCFTYLSPYTTIILYLFIGGLHIEDKQLVAKLRKKYIENPPEDMTPELVKNMSDSDLLDMSYFLIEGDYDDEYDDEVFFIF